jgi:hypothetical protein
MDQANEIDLHAVSSTSGRNLRDGFSDSQAYKAWIERNQNPLEVSFKRPKAEGV